MDLFASEEKAPETVWQQYVPIVEQDNIINIYITQELSYPWEYNEFKQKLLMAKDYNIINLYINCPGGMVDSAFYMYDAIKNCKGKVIGHLSGTVASGGTIITMACSDITVAEFTQFMIHNYSAHGISGKGHEIKDYVKFNDSELNIAFKKIYGNFLTEKEIQEIIDGKDLWINTENVLSRWESKINIKEQ